MGLEGPKKHANKSSFIDVEENGTSTGGPSIGGCAVRSRGHKVRNQDLKGYASLPDIEGVNGHKSISNTARKQLKTE
jgi:hypothetical protein